MKALIVSGTQKIRTEIADIVKSSGSYDVAYAPSVSAAFDETNKDRYDLVIINSDSTEQARATASAIAKRDYGGVIFLENASAYEKTHGRLSPLGIVVVAKPLSRTSLMTAVQTVHAANIRVAELKEVNKSLEQQLKDLKLIDRAKIALITHFGYSEDEAHKYIEKQAMNLRTTKREVAMNILKTYEI